MYQGTYKNSFAAAFDFFKNWHFILPEDGTHVLKHVRDAPLVFVLIKNINLDGIIMLYTFIHYLPFKYEPLYIPWITGNVPTLSLN
jgi:hypothetical protein